LIRADVVRKMQWKWLRDDGETVYSNACSIQGTGITVECFVRTK